MFLGYLCYPISLCVWICDSLESISTNYMVSITRNEGRLRGASPLTESLTTLSPTLRAWATMVQTRTTLDGWWGLWPHVSSALQASANGSLVKHSLTSLCLGLVGGGLG